MVDVDWAERALVFGIVVIAVTIGAVVATPATAPTRSVAEAPEPAPEFQPQNTDPERYQSSGAVQLAEGLTVDGGMEEKTVLILRGRKESEDYRQIATALTLAGHDVELLGRSLRDDLADADAMIVMDPEAGFDEDNINATRAFVENGGRVIMLAEPNRRQITASLFSVSINVVRSEMRALAREFGIVFGQRFLYNTQTNDGNYRNVIAEGQNEFSGTTAFYTAAQVEARQGTPVLMTTEGTQQSTNGSTGRFPVAVNVNDNVLAVGDSTFIEEGAHNVADNEAFIEYMIGYALQGNLNEFGFEQALDEGEDEGVP